jgi:hypothetical protein
MIAALAPRCSLEGDESRTPADSWPEKEIDVLRTGTLALAAVIAALFLGGASAHAAAEAPPANDNFADAILLSGWSGNR